MYQNDWIISPEKLIETITTSIFYLKQLKWHGCILFLGYFCSSQWPSQIGPTAENDGAAIPPLIFFFESHQLIEFLIEQGF